jgi:PKD repeat protein
MNGKSRFFLVFAILVGIMMLFSAFAPLPIIEPGSDELASNVPIFDEEIETPEKRETRAGNPRVVLAEYYTNWNCTFCKNGDPVMDQLGDEYDSSELAIIIYHVWWPGSKDPYYLHNKADNEDRTYYYNVNGEGTPYLRTDGLTKVVGAGSPESAYTNYKTEIDNRASVLSPLKITVSGNLGASTGNVNAFIEATDTVPGVDLTVQFAIVEDNLWEDIGSNGIDRHRFVMRDMLPTETLSGFGNGDSVWHNKSFSVSPVWDRNNVQVIVFVQRDDTQEVLQTGQYDFIPQKILVVDDDQSSPQPYGYEDDYEDLLTHMGYSFDGWVVTASGSPTASDLENYEAVIWLTSDSTTNTLTAADQTAITEYMDNSRGGLFLNGEDIGMDIGSSLFYWNYLHSFFVSDTTSDIDITGISSDPISDPYFSVDIPITGGSPSIINPMTNATTVFKYSPSSQTAAIKAGHDLDSRVVYFPFLYFEGPDSEANKMDVMERVLNWMVVKVDYVKFMDSPGDSGNVVTNPDLDVGESATLWGAAYNHTYGFLENYPITTWMEDSGGSLLTISSPGSSTLVTAGLSGGSVTLTMDYFGVQNTTTITINTPEPNLITLTNSPDGTEIPNISLLASEEVTIYASSYNDTSGYIGLVDVNWDDSLGLGSFDNASGTSTTFKAGNIGGITTITGDYPSYSLSDSFDITVFDAVVDYLQIRDAPGDSGNVLTDLFFNVGDSQEIWCAAYNNSAGFLGNSASTLWTENSGGTLITIPSSGSSIIVTALLVGGSTTLNTTYSGNFESIPVTVFPPQIDYIRINYESGPSGTPVVDPVYSVGFDATYFGASYNYTALYLGEVPPTSSWISTNDNIVSVSSPGSSSSIDVSDTQSGTITLKLSNGIGQTYQTTITVLPATVDYIRIRNRPNGQGNIVTSPTYDVGDEDTYYSACYNYTAGYLGDLPVSWDTTDESVGNITGSGPSVNFIAADIGTCDITADFGGLVDITISIIVNDVTPPIANAGNDASIKEEETLSFSTVGSSDNGKIVSIFWDFGDGGTYLGTQSFVVHVYEDPGTYTAKLTITDSGGNIGSDEITITVWDITAPTAVINLQGDTEEDVPYFFDGGGSSDNVGIVTYIWNFGDGNQYLGPYANVTHIYETQGTYTVKLTVKDAAGHEDSTTSEITVIDTTGPSTPKGIKVDPKNDGSTLEISWDAVADSDLDHYELYVSINDGASSKIKDIDKAALKYLHTQLDMQTSYKYYLIAVDSSDNPSADSAVVEGFCDIDSDSDGILDLVDDDDDNDGLSDFQEVLELTDPKNPDSDGDLHLDGDDAFPLNKNEWKDTDFDGIGDSEDAFPKDASEWLDSDGDGIGDSNDFLPIHNLLFLIIIAAAIIASLVAVMMIVKKKRNAKASFDGQQTTVSQDVQTPIEQYEPPQQGISDARPPPPKRLQK